MLPGLTYLQIQLEMISTAQELVHVINNIILFASHSYRIGDIRLRAGEKQVYSKRLPPILFF